jgi:hydrogenase/urease accessory protein HupE
VACAACVPRQYCRIARVPLSAGALCLLTAAALSLCPAPRAAAHTLLPKKLLQYMEEHPHATTQELEAFMQTDPAMYDGNAGYKAKIIAEVQNPQAGGFWNTCGDFFALGVNHILSGLDHILFVLSLVLFFVSLRATLKLISMFTLSHSITLILAGTDILRVSSTVVEPLIAFSIVYVALTSAFLRRYPFFASQKNKALSVFGFGLFHGMGFAGLLRELSIPGDKFVPALVSFNVGIEAGQLCILALALPFIYFFRNASWYGRAMQVFALVISVVAFGWMIQRLRGA